MSARFSNTRWSLVVRARDSTSAERSDALEAVCKQYWYPLYCFVKGKGYSTHDAQDLVQGFFEQLLRDDFFASVDPAKGKFRSFLLAVMVNHISNTHRRQNALKRGGRRRFVAIEQAMASGRYDMEPVIDQAPDQIFDKRWAESVLEHSLSRLRDEMDGGGKVKRFEALKPHLLHEKESSYKQTAAELGVAVSAVKSAIFRMRQRFHAIFREEIAHTVSTPDEIDGEIRYLFSVLTSR